MKFLVLALALFATTAGASVSQHGSAQHSATAHDSGDAATLILADCEGQYCATAAN